MNNFFLRQVEFQLFVLRFRVLRQTAEAHADLYITGEGGHSQFHCGQILPEDLMWLWRDFDEKKGTEG